MLPFLLLLVFIAEVVVAAPSPTPLPAHQCGLADSSTLLLRQTHARPNRQFLHVKQLKTGVKLAIPLSLRSEVLDISLAQVIKRCRDRVVRPWLLHHVTSSGKVKASDQVGENSLSVSFKLAVDSTNLSIERGKTMPTFHEQRSLSERLYEAQGINTQQLLGHSSEKMTAQYHNDRGLDWVKVKV